MPIYDYMTPFEEQGSPIPADSLPRMDPSSESAKLCSNIDTPSFDIAAAWFNHAVPAKIQQHTANPPSGQPQLEVRMPTNLPLAYSPPTNIEEIIQQCTCDGSVSANDDMAAQKHCCPVCADIARVREVHNIQCHSSANTDERSNLSSERYHRRRRTIFSGSVGSNEDKNWNPTGQELLPSQEVDAVDQDMNQFEEKLIGLKYERDLLEAQARGSEQEFTFLPCQ
jgi:hypothetical protein